MQEGQIDLFSKRQSALPPKSEEVIFAHLWQQFESLFPKEEDCWRELCRRFEADGLVKCHYCGSKNLDENTAVRVRKCMDCHKITWLTAGTFFAHMRLAKPWLAAIWLMEHGTVISSSKLHKLIGISQSSAFDILKKLAAVICSNFNDNASLVPSEEFCSVYFKRSRLTPAQEHPVKEQGEMERKMQDDLVAPKLTDVGEAPSSKLAGGQSLEVNAQSLINSKEAFGQNGPQGQQKQVYDVLSSAPLSFNTLCNRTGMSVSDMATTLTMLELSQQAQRLPGDRYVLRVPKEMASASPYVTTLQTTKLVGDFINFVRSKFHGISRKYVQHYLAKHWCQVAKSRWRNGALLQACIEHGAIRHEQILAYVSPLMVKTLPEPT